MEYSYHFFDTAKMVTGGGPPPAYVFKDMRPKCVYYAFNKLSEDRPAVITSKSVGVPINTFKLSMTPTKVAATGVQFAMAGIEYVSRLLASIPESRGTVSRLICVFGNDCYQSQDGKLVLYMGICAEVAPND
jgi:hypothetical protein